MKDLNKLHPWVQDKANELVALCKANGITITITQTLRTKAEQDALYAQGRTKPGKVVTNAKYPQSLHCWGIAFDFAPVVNGSIPWGDSSLFKRVGKLAQSIGLEWGGAWTSFVDLPHCEAPNHSWRELQTKWGTPERYIASWKK